MAAFLGPFDAVTLVSVEVVVVVVVDGVRIEVVDVRVIVLL